MVFVVLFLIVRLGEYPLCGPLEVRSKVSVELGAVEILLGWADPPADLCNNLGGFEKDIVRVVVAHIIPAHDVNILVTPNEVNIPVAVDGSCVVHGGADEAVGAIILLVEGKCLAGVRMGRKGLIGRLVLLWRAVEDGL